MLPFLEVMGDCGFPDRGFDFGDRGDLETGDFLERDLEGVEGMGPREGEGDGEMEGGVAGDNTGDAVDIDIVQANVFYMTIY